MLEPDVLKWIEEHPDICDFSTGVLSSFMGQIATWNNCGDDADAFCEDESHWGIGFGPGIGFELRMLDNVAWSVEIPLAVMYADGEFFGLYPVPNSSLVYYW